MSFAEEKPRHAQSLRLRPPLPGAEWVELFVAFLCERGLNADPQRILNRGRELWPEFGHLDPRTVAVAAQRIWQHDD